MEFIETSISNLTKYTAFLEDKLVKNVNESLEREDMLKTFILCKKVITLMCEKFTLEHQHIFEEILNEVYVLLRKINSAFSEFMNGSYFSREKNMKLFKDACLRNELYLREIHNDLKQRKIFTVKSKNQDKKSQIDSNTVFLLKLNYQKNIPNTAENIFINLVQFKDEVYYLKTSDTFGFFYFYRTNEGLWYWSPPRKTDPEDIWIPCPEVVIDKGYWIDKKIPDFVENFIIWLSIFTPNIPEFYKKPKIDKPFKDPKDNYENFANDMAAIQHNMNENKDCIIF